MPSFNLGAHAVAVRKRVPLQGKGAGFTTVPDGALVGTVTVVIDTNKLNEYARKAVGSKGLKSKLAHGAIVFIASNVRKIGGAA